MGGGLKITGSPAKYMRFCPVGPEMLGFVLIPFSKEPDRPSAQFERVCDNIV